MLANLSQVAGAIAGDEVVPFFQPLVDLRSGMLRGFELLARWQRSPQEATLPANFIRLAEESGLIEALTDQVFRKGFRAAATLPAPLTLSVNISPIQLYDSTLPAKLQALSTETGFLLERLIIEITESALMQDLAEVYAIAAQLKAMGCKLALDDFGTGFSSLRHLQSLPFDELKIDRSFVCEMTKKRESRKIVAAIIGLGHSLGLATVAEGVETEEQAHMLLWLGCELGQGWRYGHAEPAEQLPAIVAAEPQASIPELSTPGDEWASSNLEALPTLQLAQLQAIYDGAPVGLCFLDRKLRYVSLNRRLAELNGLSVKAHLGRSIQELFPGWFPVVEPYLLRALQGEAIAAIEFTRPSANPGEADRTLQASYQPARDEADEVIGVSVSLLDLTDNKLAEDPSDAAPGAEAGAMEEGPGLPLALKAEGNDAQSSSQWVRTTLLGKERTRNLRWLEALHADDLENTVTIMKEAMRSGRSIEIKYRVQGVDGEWRWMSSTGSPRFNATGEIIRWYGNVEDINDRQQGEK
jgi:PAS domain S-box-containing protein